MSNVKISQLPAASTFSPAADVAPIVHSGVTQKATFNQIVQSVLPSPGAIGSVTPSTAQFSALTLVSASGLQKAVGGLFTNAIAGTDYLPPTTGSAIQKANGVGGLTNATPGSDYAPPTAGTSILYGNGTGGFSNVTVGSGLTFASGTLASTSAGGSVTSVAVLNSNGLAGTVANATTTPAITLSTTVTGLLKGNGTAISAAVSGTDYAPATTGTSILKGNGSGGFSNAVSNTDYQSVITATGILKGAGSGSISAAVVGTDYAPATSGTSILKGNGTGGFSSATAGTDYAAPTTGTNAQLLANNGSGGFSNVTVGSGLTYSAGTLAATAGGGGTVTDVSVVSANGFAGTVATSTTTPAITLSTSVTGLLKGNGTGVSAAVSGTDYAPATSGSSILYGNGSGGFSNVTVGSGLSFAAGTLTATGGGSGTVTSVSGTGTVSGISLSGTVTTSGSLTLGGTLDLSSPPAIGDTSPNTGAFTRVTVTGSTAPTNGMFLPTTNTLAWSTNSTEKMRLDSSGNLGLGVTPSGWSAGKAIEIGNAGDGLSINYGAGLNLNRNAYYNGGFKYGSTDYASRYAQTNGQHQWYTAPSGTAGNAISFTQAMTLDASGNLLVGTTTANGRVTIQGPGTSSATYSLSIYSATPTASFRVRDDGAVFTGASTSGLAACPYNNTTANAANLTVGTGGDLQRSTSSARYKNSIADAVHGLAEVLKLRPVTYKGNNDGDTVFGGLIAEEVHDAGLVEFVQYNDEGEPDALAYGNMVSLAFKAIQELSAELNLLKQKVNA